MNNKVEHVSLAIQDDFLAHQTRALPISALAELIWNSLDSEAGSINVEFQRDDLAGGLFGSGGAGLDRPRFPTDPSPPVAFSDRHCHKCRHGCSRIFSQ